MCWSQPTPYVLVDIKLKVKPCQNVLKVLKYQLEPSRSVEIWIQMIIRIMMGVFKSLFLKDQTIYELIYMRMKLSFEKIPQHDSKVFYIVMEGSRMSFIYLFIYFILPLRVMLEKLFLCSFNRKYVTWFILFF